MNIVLDIETIPCDDQVRTILPPIQPPSKLQGEELEDWHNNILPELKKRQFLQTALDGTFGQVACIGILLFDEDKNFFDGTVIYGNDETRLLQIFWSMLGQYRKPLFITHNGLGFDLPFILKRSIIRSVKPTQKLNLSRYRTDFVYDTMAVWANWDYKKNIKLDTLAKVLGVGEKNGNGANVFGQWSEGKYEEVARYCFQDVYITYACYCKMNFLDIKPISTIPIKLIECKSPTPTEQSALSV